VLAHVESQKEMIRPDFDRAIMRDFQGAQIASDTGFILFLRSTALRYPGSKGQVCQNFCKN
jgi:hypothetical protein